MPIPAHDSTLEITDPDAADRLLDIDTRDPIDTMPTGTFTSSNVHSVLYDFGERELYVRYLRDGADAIYRYDGVPAQVWQGLVNAESKGSFINRSVAFEYVYTQLNAGDLPDDGRGVGSDLLRRFLTDP